LLVDFWAAGDAVLRAQDDIDLKNLAVLPPWLSDTLCRLASGGAFVVRQLYTDQDEMLFAAARPVILNGIEDAITRSDLADRAIKLTLESGGHVRARAHGRADRMGRQRIGLSSYCRRAPKSHIGTQHRKCGMAEKSSRARRPATARANIPAYARHRDQLQPGRPDRNASSHDARGAA
jgi:hypothetical protein